MTCQVVLANGHGVALASDTAVTVGSGIVHTGAQKIHPIGEAHPIAVLHAHSTVLSGIPVDVLLAEWAGSLGTDRLETVEAYRESFLGWLELTLDTAVADHLHQEDSLAFVTDLMRSVWRDMKNMLEGVDPEHSEHAVDSWLASCLARWHDVQELEGFNGDLGHETFGKLVTSDAEWPLEKRFEYWFDDVPRSDEIDARLWLLLEEMFRKSCHPLDSARLTFAGFGNAELFAAVAGVDVRSFVNHTLLVNRISPLSVEDASPHAICVRVAQKSAIETFLTGFSADLVEEVASGLEDSATGSPHELSEGSYASQRLTPVGEVLREKLDAASQQQRMGKFWNVVSVLPSSALAETAKRLVNIQSLDLLLRGEVETVSKDCHLALITKSEGFAVIQDVAA